MKMPKICGVSADEFFIRMEEFHGYRSPGILIGGLMMAQAWDHLGSTPYLNVVCETVICLPDAVQLLTPCTYGNGFLQVLDWGKFALTAYDRKTLLGQRVWLNSDRLVEYPLIGQWFQRTGKSREKPPFDTFAKEAFEAGPTLINRRSVTMKRPLKDLQPVPTGRCARCGEFYPRRHGPVCKSCSGAAYWT